MDLIKGNETEYEEYERLLLERDQLLKESDQIWTEYLRIFGQLLAENYEEKLECIKCKKTIAYFQRVINRGGQVDSKDLEEYLDREMAGYYANLKSMIRDSERAKGSGICSAYEVKRSKKLYRRLAKLIHPDINPDAGTNEELMELWHRVQTAYRSSDVKALTELEVLVRKVLKELGTDGAGAEIPDIGDRIEEVKDEIEDIVSSEPYTLRELVDDDEAAGRKKEEILKETEEYRKYRKELGEIILKMMSGGGLSFHAE